jgi:integrase
MATIRKLKDKYQDVDADTVLNYIKQRLETVKPDTVIKEINVISGIYKFAQTVWNLPVKQNHGKEGRSIANSIGLLKGANVQRISRLTDSQYEKIRKYQAKNGSLVKFACLLAIETGMRRSELTNMEWRHVDLLHGVYHLPKEKSDHSKKIYQKGRIVPLTFRARAILRLLSINKDNYPYVWSWRDPTSFTRANRKMLNKLGIDNVRLHDYRHEFGSVQADNEVDIRITASAMGHVDLRSMARYSHPDMIKHAKMIKGRR